MSETQRTRNVPGGSGYSEGSTAFYSGNKAEGKNEIAKIMLV
jgi:hypothetical protein